MAVANFGSCQTDDYSENNLTVLTNLGDIQIISLPFLKLQTRYPCIRKEDVSGIASCVFTKYGQGTGTVIEGLPLVFVSLIFKTSFGCRVQLL